MKRDLPDFKTKASQTHQRLSPESINKMLDAGRAWDLAPALSAGGSIIFPHVGIEACGHQIASAVHACLNSGANKVLVVGVLHALTQELQDARVRVSKGSDVTLEDAWGIQGPGLNGRTDWHNEFSLSHFLFLWDQEIKRRGIKGPELVVRYPYLAGGRPFILPGIEELQQIVRDGAAVVMTADPFHHGVGYDDAPEDSFYAEAGGLELARQRIEEGLEMLRIGDYWGYNQHCAHIAKNDARDGGQVVRYLLGPLQGQIHDIVWEDMAPLYHKPDPTWVTGALIELLPVKS